MRPRACPRVIACGLSVRSSIREPCSLPSSKSAPLNGRRTVQAARSAYDSMSVQAGGTLTAAQPGTGGKRGRRDAGHAVIGRTPVRDDMAPAARSVRGIGRHLGQPTVTSAARPHPPGRRRHLATTTAASVVTLSDVQDQGKRAQTRLIENLRRRCGLVVASRGPSGLGSITACRPVTVLAYERRASSAGSRRGWLERGASGRN